MNSVIVEKNSNGVIWVTINRPEAMNAMSLPVMKQLCEAFEQVAQDREAKAVVFTGAGDRAFCAGGDIKAGSDGEESPYQLLPGDDHPLVQLYKVVDKVQVPIIARVNGHALGGGFGLVCMADMAICSRNAKLGSPEAKIGLFPMVILSHMLRLVPLRKLYEMAITGRNWSADEAFEAGILNSVVDDQETLDEAVNKLLENILANAPLAIRIGKKALKSMEHMTFEERLSHSQIIIDSLSKTEDAQEGMLAFTEKRKPVWTGK